MAALADDFGERIKELRDLFGESQEEFGARWGRAGKQIGVWERGEQQPRWRTVLHVAKEQGWPPEMFERGGPMPAVALKRPVNGRTVRESSSTPSATPKPRAGHVVYRAAILEVTRYLERGEPVPAATAIKLLSEVYEATRPASGAGGAGVAVDHAAGELFQKLDEAKGQNQDSG